MVRRHCPMSTPFSLYFILLFRLEHNNSLYSTIENVHEQLFFQVLCKENFFVYNCMVISGPTSFTWAENKQVKDKI
jgi:hypothetical protein